MAMFPNTENNIKALAAQMQAGYTAHPTDFPSVNVAALTAALNNYDAARAAQQSTQAAAKAATVAKAQRLVELVAVMKNDLKLSEVDAASEPVKLDEIGWGTKAQPTALTPPNMATDLTAGKEGAGTVTLQWKKPAGGGAVRNYIIERQQADDVGVLGNWQMLTFAYDNVVDLTDQPRGTQMQYRVIAANTAGQSNPSNTVPVVL